jgi:hypothetical protein
MKNCDVQTAKCKTGSEPQLFVAACRQTAAFLQQIELSGFLPKAATPFCRGLSL